MLFRSVVRVGLIGVWVGGQVIFAQTNPVAPATPEAAAEWALSLGDNARMQALQGVLNGWAQTDPAAAATWSKRLREQDRWATFSIISTWSSKDPKAASEWVATFPDGQARIQAFEVLGSAWGVKNREEALGWAQQLPAEAERQSALGGVVQSWAMQDSAAALKYAQEASEGKLKDHLLGKVILGWSYKDRPAAEKWVRELPAGDLKKSMEKLLSTSPASPVIRRRVLPVPPTAAVPSKKITLSFPTPPELSKILESPVNQARQDALIRYVLEWFGREPEKATQWVSAKLEGLVLAKAAGAVAREWSKKDLAAAGEWVRQIPPFWKDFVILLGSEWAADDPNKVVQAAWAWPESLRRQVILRGVCDQWAQRDPQTAAAWTDSLPDGPTKTEIRKGLMIGWAGKDAAGFRSWSDKLTNPEEKKLVPHLVLHGLGRLNPAEGVAQLKNWPVGGDSNANQTVCFGKEWAAVNPQAAADWAKSLAEGRAKEAALKSVLRIWAYQDAAGVAGWAEQLPEQESRASALEAVMETWIEQDPRAALIWAEGVKDPDRKLEALCTGLRIWGQREPVEARAWVERLPEGREKTALWEVAKPPRTKGIAVGEEAPDFTVPTLDGKTFKLSDYRGKYVLLDFWATWCGPCLGETPNLKKVFEAHGKKENFIMVGLSLDQDAEKPKTYLKENGCGWVDGFLGDWGKDKVTKKYGVRGIPTILLIGPDGKVVANHLRGDAILAAVGDALEGKK